VTQIGGAMGQLSKATQQNASASEQLAATSEELSGQAQQLQESIAFFNTAQAQAAPQRSTPALTRRAGGSAAPRLAARTKPASASNANFRPY
jgi:methyl-accepting chemotaxis protein